MLVMSFFICVSLRLLLVIEADGDDFASGVAVKNRRNSSSLLLFDF